MRMQLLGTAGGDFPRVDDLEDNFAYLPRVRALGGRNLRRPAQAVISPDILIDYFDGRQLEKFDITPESIKHLFITHGHWDHCRPKKVLEFAAGLPHQLQVYGNNMVIEALKFADTYNFNSSNGRFTLREAHTDIGFHELKPGQSFNIGDTTIVAVHSNHSINKIPHMIMTEQSLNYVFVRDGKTVFYGLDSSYPFPLTVECLRQFDVDVAVLDATFGQWPIDPVKSGHHNLDMLAETIKEFREAGIFHEKTILLASHIALVEILPYDDLKDEAAKRGMTLAYDGMVIDI
ncbi:MAG: hypothetical protein HN368_04595 [Spirochaetales bacterium]|jgi:phosphoribosyl 1,2-cyclic phosphate phosphodiesterase|nr:hypothetical protein [Spirochaetales bacterium]